MDAQTVRGRRWGNWTTAVLAAFFLLCTLWAGLAAAAPAAPATTGAPLGYGFNVAAWDVALVQDIGFGWIKVFNPPGSRLPVKVLLRVEAQAWNMSDLDGYGADLHALAAAQAGYVDAYEIGNEPNLDASYGWAAPPNAADYAALLCVAYANIKTADPQARVISAGLAPTGRVQGNWNGHPGHNGFYQDERAFFLEFLAAGGGSCLDGVGYHPYGFSADFDAAPDVASSDPTQNCSNGFCFRGTEKLYELMAAQGLGEKKMWATEFGWLVTPPDHCLSDGSWDGRLWQLVSPEQQAGNLVGAYQYAAANWSWMEAMFIFNLNFNTAPYYPECEQMRFYSVSGRPAEQALRQMPKEVGQAVLAASPPAFHLAARLADLPYSRTVPLSVRNEGVFPLTYTIGLTTTGAVTLTLSQAAGLLLPGQSATVSVGVASPVQPAGAVSGALRITAVPSDTAGAPVNIPVTLHIFAEIHHQYLPLLNGR